jgi:hypothetical protein
MFNELAQKKINVGLGMINFYFVELTHVLVSKANSVGITLIAPKLIFFKNSRPFSNIRITDINGLTLTLKELMTNELGAPPYSMIAQSTQQQSSFGIPALRTTKPFDHQNTPIYKTDSEYNKELLPGNVGIIPYTSPWKADFL